MFPQVHGPGLRDLLDFYQDQRRNGNHCRQGAKMHRLYHFRLAYSDWSYARVALGGMRYRKRAYNPPAK